MKTLIMLLILSSTTAKADMLMDMANRNGFNPSLVTVAAIKTAAQYYGINPNDLMAIAILETGAGKYNTVRRNKNGTQDIGMFQINTVNIAFCKEFNLKDLAGNALCAAKLLHRIKHAHKSDTKAIARYHSNTPKYKELYYKRLTAVRE